MSAMDTHIRIELTIPGDDGHVSHRIREAVASLTRIGFRLAVRLDGGTVYLMQDHEEPVDSSTVDGGWTGWRDAGYIDETVSPPVVVGDPRVGAVRADADDAGVPDRFAVDPGQTTGVYSPPVDDDRGPGPVLLPEVCGMPVCGHTWTVHRHGGKSAVAGQMAARRPGTFCLAEVTPGTMCNCPGFTPVTGTLLSKPGPY